MFRKGGCEGGVCVGRGVNGYVKKVGEGVCTGRGEGRGVRAEKGDEGVCVGRGGEWGISRRWVRGYVQEGGV